MAIDEAIAACFGPPPAVPTLRFYSWARPSFSIGRFQTLSPEFVALLKAHSIPLVRRVTGGGGVFHHHEITYSIVASTADRRFSGGVQGAFSPIVLAFAAGLKRLGVPAEVCLSPPEHGRASNPLCFAVTSKYEVVAGGRNLIGSAMRRWRDRFLLQGSVGLTRGEMDAPFAPPQRAVLSDFLHAPMVPEPIQNSLLDVLGASLHIAFEATEMTPQETAAVRRRVAGDETWPDHNRIASV